MLFVIAKGVEATQASTSWWTEKQTVPYSRKTILFGLKNECCYMLQHGEPKWRKPVTKDAQYMIPWVWNIKDRQICIYSRSWSSRTGSAVGMEENEKELIMGTRWLLEWWKYYKIKLCWHLHKSVNILEISELYTKWAWYNNLNKAIFQNYKVDIIVSILSIETGSELLHNLIKVSLN